MLTNCPSRAHPAKPARERRATLRARFALLLAASLAFAGLGGCESSEVASEDDDDETDTDRDSAEDSDDTDEAPPASRQDAGSKPAKPDASSGSGTKDSGANQADASDHATHEDSGAGPDAGPAPSGPHDHCVDGELPDPADSQLSGAPDEWRASNGAIDLVLPGPVLSWMDDRVWKQSHDAWHNVRRCAFSGGFGGFPGFGDTTICENTELVPADQECENASDGYQFLVMHRHMMIALRQAFPEHTELFEGFPTFPFNATDVPEQWRGRWGTGWSQSIVSTARTLEDIENKLSQFPTEGDLGMFIQCGGMSSGASSIHGALHFKWVVNESPNSLGKQTVNIGNYMFWKLHGWIDNIWERYRVAKGLTADEPKLKQELEKQCREMHTLGKTIDPSVGGGPVGPLPDEAGVFHESVRPILEKYCSGCHSESSPEAGLPLGGEISSADIVKALVDVASRRGGQFPRVVPGEPDQSWLYLKVSGTAMSAGCTGANCNAQVMPPAGQVTLTQAELATIRDWIADGAPAPTQ